jgi:hypothetical protein
VIFAEFGHRQNWLLRRFACKAHALCKIEPTLENWKKACFGVLVEWRK